jgi:hypothetical protein
MISNYTRRSCWKNILRIIFARQLMSFFYLGDQKSFSAYNRLWRDAGTVMLPRRPPIRRGAANVGPQMITSTPI